jgi:hypothetical protein
MAVVLASMEMRRHLWQTGQKNVERPLCTMRWMTPLQPGLRHASPSRS